MTTVNQKLRALREKMNLSMAEFGRRIEYSPTHVKRLEEGTTPVSESCLNRICDVFNINPDYFTSDLPLDEAMDAEVPEAEVEPVERVPDGRAPERIKELRTSSGLSQRLFADKAHVDASMISEIEAGNRELSLKAAKKIGEAYEIGFEWLLYGDCKKKDFPVSDRLIDWLWQNVEVRKELWSRMNRAE